MARKLGDEPVTVDVANGGVVCGVLAYDGQVGDAHAGRLVGCEGRGSEVVDGMVKKVEGGVIEGENNLGKK